MITLKRLKLNNFLSHSDTVIEFNDSEKVLFDGVSGSGKTSLVEAITWNLYGIGRVANRDLVKRGSTVASVELTLLDGETVYQITRTTTDKAKNTLSILTGNIGDKKLTHIGKMGLKEMQSWIENDLLHASYMLFVNSIAYVQDNADTFVKQTAARRKEILLEIIGGGDYSALYEKARDILTASQNSIASTDGEIIAMERSIEYKLEIAAGLDQAEKDEKTCTAEVEVVKEALAKTEKMIGEIAVYRSEYDGLVRDKSRVERDIATAEGKISFNQTRIHQILSTENSSTDLIEKVNSLKTFLDKVPDDLEDRVMKEQERKNKISQLMSNRPAFIDYDAEIAQLNKQLIPLVRDSNKCPSGDACPFIAPIQGQIDYISEAIERKKAQKSGLEFQQAEYAKSIEELGLEIASPEDYSLYLEAKSKSREIDQYRSVLSSIEENKKIVAEIQLNIATLQDEISLKKIEISAIEVNLAASFKKIDELLEWEAEKKTLLEMLATSEDRLIKQRVKLSSCRSAHDECEKLKKEIPLKKELIKETRENIKALQLAKDAFGPKGLTAVVIDYLIPELEERINGVLAQLSDFRINIDTQRPNSTGDGIIEGLFLNIYNDRGEVYDYDSYSGGQRVKIHVAISEALASLQKVGFRIFDEAVVALDPQSSEDFMEVMEKLQAKFNQMICITHLQNIKDLFEKKVMIVRVNGESKVASV